MCATATHAHYSLYEGKKIQFLPANVSGQSATGHILSILCLYIAIWYTGMSKRDEAGGQSVRPDPFDDRTDYPQFNPPESVITLRLARAAIIDTATKFLECLHACRC